MAAPTFDLASTYLHLAASGEARRIEGTPAFWADLTSAEPKTTDAKWVSEVDGWFVTSYPLDVDFPHWEMHPRGDELLLLTSGAADAVIEQDGVAQTFRVEPFRAFVVPKGAWHRLLVRAPGTLLALTYGKGTEHRAL